MIQHFLAVFGLITLAGILIVILAAWFTHLDVSRFRNDAENIQMDRVLIETIKSDVERMLQNEKDPNKKEALQSVLELLSVRYEQHSMNKKIL
jgi:hypothetical protein